MAAYSHIISLKDLECNNSLAGSDPKDFVLSNSFARKFWLSPRKDLGTIIRTRRVLAMNLDDMTSNVDCYFLGFLDRLKCQ